MMQNIKKGLLMLSLLGIAGSGVLAQDAVLPPPNSNVDIKAPSQADIEKYTREMERMSRASANPAYRPLFEAFDHFTKITPQIPKSIFISPISGIVKFAETPDLKAGMAKTRNWLNTFTGPDPNFAPPQANSGFMGMIGSFALLTSGIPLEAGWASETRLALANGKNDLAIQNFDEAMRFGQALSMDSVVLGFASLEFQMKNPIVYVHAVPAFTLRQCNEMQRVIDRVTSSTAWERGLEKSLREEQEQAMDMIQDDGSVFDLAKQGEELEKVVTSGRDADGNSEIDLGKQLDVLFAPRTKHSINPSPEAVAKRQVVAKAVEEDYARLQSVLRDPFLPLLPKPERPAWIESVRGFSLVSFMDEGMLPELQKPRLQLRLLAVHTAIRKFRWNHDRLPKDLSELKAKAVTTDPVNGKPFLYKMDGETYTLTSAGVSVRNSEGKSVASTVPYDLMTESIPEFGTMDGLGMSGMSAGTNSEMEVIPLEAPVAPTSPRKE